MPMHGHLGRYAPLAALGNNLSFHPSLFSLIINSHLKMQHIQRNLDSCYAFV